MRNLVQFILQWLRIKPAYSQTIETERQCLAKHAAKRMRLVEIGVFQGVTTRVLRNVMDPDATLFCIDPFFRNRLGFCFYRIIAMREVGGVKNGRVRWLEMTSAEALGSGVFVGEDELDFVFIDGDHSWEGIEVDWKGFSPLVRRGGIIALHDSRNRGGCGSERFTNEEVLKDPRFRVVDVEHSLTVLERI